MVWRFMKSGRLLRATQTPHYTKGRTKLVQIRAGPCLVEEEEQAGMSLILMRASILPTLVGGVALRVSCLQQRLALARLHPKPLAAFCWDAPASAVWATRSRSD